MPNNQNIIKAFVNLGDFLNQFSENGIHRKPDILNNQLYFDGMKHQINLARQHNGWFTEKNVLFALENWSKILTNKNIKTWISKYNFNNNNPKVVAIIMAGNIPLVGFHDFLSVLVSGHAVLIKQSSNDSHLLPFLAKYLQDVEPSLNDKITFIDENLKYFDSAIATGSDNTARYFEYYLKNKPRIIRKNRNSIAVLTGNESKSQLEALSEDIFRYYGLGCRNVSKLFVPKKYNFDLFFEAIYKWHPIINENKYANNYDYNKAVYLMSEFDLLENGFLMLKEDSSYNSPIASLFYETYDNIEELKKRINANKDKIQCIVSNGIFDNEINFGDTQIPKLWDYADGIDTVEFLLKI